MRNPDNGISTSRFPKLAEVRACVCVYRICMYDPHIAKVDHRRHIRRDEMQHDRFTVTGFKCAKM